MKSSAILVDYFEVNEAELPPVSSSTRNHDSLLLAKPLLECRPKCKGVSYLKIFDLKVGMDVVPQNKLTPLPLHVAECQQHGHHEVLWCVTIPLRRDGIHNPLPR